jgi:hypothetical protein
MAGEGEPDGLLGQEERDALAGIQGGAGDEERNDHALRILRSGREVDHDLRVVPVRHGDPPCRSLTRVRGMIQLVK